MTDSCRPVALPSGETVLVRGRGGLGPAGVAAFAEVVDAARALVRLAQGRLPCGEVRTAVQAWLETQESAGPDVTWTD